MIRPAIEADIPDILRMGRMFWAQTAYASIPFCLDSMTVSVRQMMAAHLLLMAEMDGVVAGSIGALASPLYANRAIQVAAELWFWVEPGYRKSGVGRDLMQAMEDAARAQGVHLMTMISLEAVEPEIARQMYLRSGYEMTEHSFLKVL